MSWHQKLRKASFRGIEFFYSDAEGGFGRRQANHEYPDRDLPYIEDLGRKSREHTIQCYVLEPDHIAKAAKLVEACEKSGPGTLVHPYLGEMTVVCTDCRQRYTTRDGGMARFTLTFAEAGDNRYPETQTNTPSAVNSSANNLLNSLQTSFKTSFNVGGFPEFVASDAAKSVTTAASDIVATIQKTIRSGEQLASLGRDVTDLTTNASTYVRDPVNLASKLQSLIGRVQSVTPLPAENVFQNIASFGDGLTPPPQTTPSRQQQLKNQTALARFVRGSALAERARLAANQTFATSLEATTARDRIVDLIDLETATATDGEWRSYTKLAQSVVKHVSTIAPSLPRIIKKSWPATRPALALANDLYGDDLDAVLNRADEISARNKLRHPGMAIGGNQLEVLTHAG